MSDRNNITLVGRIGDIMKKSKTSNGSTFLWIPIRIQNTLGATSVDRNFNQEINVMVFNRKIIEYLERVGARSGNNIIVFGYVAAFKQTVNGKDIVSNAINATEAYIVKTRSDDEIINSQNK